MKLTWKSTLGIAIGVVLIGGIAYTLRPKPLAVDIATVARGPLETTIDAEGRTRVRERYVVVAPVAGRVERLTQVEGALVRAGDVIARLTAVPLDSQAMAQARARLDAANAVVLEAASQLRVATAALEQQRRDLSRAQRLAEVGGAAPRVVEENELAVTQATETERSAAERLRATEADARQARAILAGQERGVGQTVTVRAPATGRVLRVPERSERIVAAGTPLLEVGDPSSLEIVVDVLSSDGANIHPGDRVRLAEWGTTTSGESTEAIGGRVRDVEPAAFTKTSALGVNEQRVNVIIDPDRIPPMIGDGFRVEASIVVWSAPDVIRVPRSALIEGAAPPGQKPRWSVYVIRDSRAELRDLKVGHAGAADAEVLDGLAAGDHVVVFPSDQIKAGSRVTLRKA
jgi:HlyD family secretion protein